MAKIDQAIVALDLRKSFKKLEVLKGIDFSVKKGTILALLGPNGAGKTTTVRILSTLLLPDGGTALVNGFDVVKQPAKVKASIGLTGQFAAVDEYLTAKENLEMVGKLYRLQDSEIKDRSDMLLQQFDLTDSANRIVKQFSGGMKRKLDLAMSLIARPSVIFLDEPTTGLDPRSRNSMWEIIKQLVREGTTILLTTQYMEEADQLADNIIVIDHGKVIAQGTPDSLKRKISSDRLEVIIAKKNDLEKARKIIEGEGKQVDLEKKAISIATTGGVKQLREVLQKLEDKKIEVESVSLHRPSLDDVFLTITGHAATEGVEKEK